MFKKVSDGVYEYSPIKFIYGRKPANPNEKEVKEGQVSFTLYTGKGFKNGR